MYNVKALCIVIFFFIIIHGLCGLEFTNENIIAYFNEQIPGLMEEYGIIGITLSLVHNGEMIFSGGYGYSNLEHKKTVDPANTLFRAGSISKLFTWTAIMQLYEQGKLDLNDDVNLYLGEYAIPDTFDEPIRIHHLMSHTPGFEDKIIGLFVIDESKQKTLGRYINEDRPKRIWPPGQEISYSNYGAAIAGFIVEKISGMPFEEYVKTYILDPLGMENTTFYQPLPGNLKDRMSTSYTSEKGKVTEQAFEIVQGAPAGAISITADDMARFLLAHLNSGSLSGVAILKPETTRLMHTTHYTQGPGVNGMAHGFIEHIINNERIIGHGGDTIYFHSSSGILQSRDFGFFISANTSTGMIPLYYLMLGFFTNFFPGPVDGSIDAQSSHPLKAYTGTYAANRRSESDLTKMFSLFMRTNVTISEERDSLEIFDVLTRRNISIVPVGNNLFQEKDGYKSYVFLENEKKEIYGLMDNSLPVLIMKRIPLFESMILTIIIIVLTVIMILTSIIVRPTGIMAYVSKKNKPRNKEEAWAGYAGSGLILSYVLFIFFLIIYISGDGVFNPMNPLPFTIIGITFFIQLIVNVFCILAWTNTYWKLPGRIYYTCVSVISTGFLGFLYYWRILFPG